MARHEWPQNYRSLGVYLSDSVPSTAFSRQEVTIFDGQPRRCSWPRYHATSLRMRTRCIRRRC